MANYDYLFDSNRLLDWEISLDMLVDINACISEKFGVALTPGHFTTTDWEQVLRHPELPKIPTRKIEIKGVLKPYYGEFEAAEEV